jgi:hypothetical protein
MVSALLDGRKTQTRRVLSIPFLEGINPQHTGLVATRSYGSTWQVYGTADASKPFDVRYAVGDLLYVREAWRVPAQDDRTPPRDLQRQIIGYEADCRRGQISATGKFRHARHMPRWASRLTLKVTDVRVERVKQISEADARAEGWGKWRTPIAWFATLWNSINAPRGFGWEENPWVVAISFSVIRANVDHLPGPQAQAEDTERERSEATTTTRTD